MSEEEAVGLDGAVALITGGTSGIGLAAARAFVKAGATVVLAARSRERGRRALDMLDAPRDRALFVATDVASSDQVERAVSRAVEVFGGLDHAVNAAAHNDPVFAPTHDLPEDDVRTMLEVTLTGVWRSMRYEIPAILARGGGAVVNVSSLNGLAGTPTAAHYCAAKHGVVGLTKTAALEYAGAGIRVNAVCPGATRTPMLEGMFERISPESPAEAEEAYRGRVPLGRLAEPDEVGRAVAWLCSEGASYVTGAVLSVDGGLAAMTPG